MSLSLPPTTKPKVFGIGLSRTGTLSLTTALRTLGFDTAHYPSDASTYATLLAGTARFGVLDRYDGITDITVVPYYQELDLLWPGAKFVLTVREEESWLRSCRRHWERPIGNKTGNEIGNKAALGEHYPDLQRFLRSAVYGCHAFHRERFLRVARRHTAEVLRHFAGRDGDLLVLDITDGQGYERLAPFLGLPVPDEPFPHHNNRREHGW
ncbi:sulfotransferase family protein [Streptosporangium nondiastaticum]|uniref:sulfotransferase family protein n=1 Tax=Streptosporangium nondiastaticum TaxID=35764 RepID=UPI0011B26280|nr:sulfotransferase family protein [Streptosporangium nondiastaticum]